jgi:hypothetical protein
MENLTVQDAFLPEAGFNFYESEFDVDDITADQVSNYHPLIMASLLKEGIISEEEIRQTAEEPYQMGICEIDIFSNDLSLLQSKVYPSLTEQEILSKLSEEEYINHLNNPAPTPMEALIKQIAASMESEDYGYEMGCLISSEFTPNPNYSGVKQLVEESQFTQDEILEYLDKQSRIEFKEGCERNEIYDQAEGCYQHDSAEVSKDYCVYLSQLDHSYTESGTLYQDLICILNQ